MIRLVLVSLALSTGGCAAFVDFLEKEEMQRYHAITEGDRYQAVCQPVGNVYATVHGCRYERVPAIRIGIRPAPTEFHATKIPELEVAPAAAKELPTRIRPAVQPLF